MRHDNTFYIYDNRLVPLEEIVSLFALQSYSSNHSDSNNKETCLKTITEIVDEILNNAV